MWEKIAPIIGWMITVGMVVLASIWQYVKFRSEIMKDVDRQGEDIKKHECALEKIDQCIDGIEHTMMTIAMGDELRREVRDMIIEYRTESRSDFKALKEELRETMRDLQLNIRQDLNNVIEAFKSAK